MNREEAQAKEQYRATSARAPFPPSLTHPDTSAPHTRGQQDMRARGDVNKAGTRPTLKQENRDCPGLAVIEETLGV